MLICFFVQKAVIWPRLESASGWGVEQWVKCCFLCLFFCRFLHNFVLARSQENGCISFCETFRISWQNCWNRELNFEPKRNKNGFVYPSVVLSGWHHPTMGSDFTRLFYAMYGVSLTVPHTTSAVCLQNKAIQLSFCSSLFCVSFSSSVI